MESDPVCFSLLKQIKAHGPDETALRCEDEWAAAGHGGIKCRSLTRLT